MEAFTYSNIFDTKGIEYIIIIFFLLVLMPFWIVVNRKVNVVKQIQQSIGALTTSILRIPKGLYYSRNHAWLYLEKSGQAKIGIDDFLYRILGDVKIIPQKQPGEKIKKGDLIATIEQEGKQLQLNSPLTGEMVEVNAAIAENNGILSSDIYNEGWIFAIQPSNWKKEILGFYFAEDAKTWITNELQRMKDFLSVALSKHTSTQTMVIFQEGGELQMNPLSGMEAEIWNDFQREFLD